MSQTERVFDILYQLSKENGSIKLRDISERYEVTERQAARDIEYIRYRIMTSPDLLVFDRGIMAYRLAKDSDVLSGWRENMLVSFAVMGSMTGNLAGKNEINSALPLSMRRILSHIDYRTPVRSYGDDERFLSPIFEAFDRNKEVIIEYRKTPEAVAEKREVDPLRLVNYQGFWYLLGYDRKKKGNRTFRLSRAESVVVAIREALPHDDKEIEEILDSSYGIFLGHGEDDPEWYTMRFCGDAAIRVSSEVWHDDQKSRWVGEEYELSVPASSPVEIQSRLLSFASDAYPLSPDSFVRTYWEAVEAMALRRKGKRV